MEGVTVFGGGEIALRPAPVTDALSHALNQLAHAGFALRRPQRPMQVLAGHNVDGGHGPVFGRLHVLLLEDAVAFGISDAGGAQLPLVFILGGDAVTGDVVRISQYLSMPVML